MNQNEIKAELERLDAAREICEREMTALTYAVDEYRNMVTALMAQLAEAEKPEFEDGDYGLTIQKRGVDSGVCSFIFVGGSVYYNTGTYDEETALSDSRFCDYVRLGNIFDDLKALSEPLRAFKLSETHISGSLSGSLICLRDRDEQSSLPLAKVRELVVYLQRLVYTAEKEDN